MPGSYEELTDPLLTMIHSDIQELRRTQLHLLTIVNDRLLTRAEVATYLQVSIPTLDRLRRADDRFPEPTYVARSPRWRFVEIRRYLQITENDAP